MNTAKLLLAAGVCMAATVTAQTPGPSTNMVSGTQWPGGDPFLQRQNEPSMAVSSRNAQHILAGANDYRTVDLPGIDSDEPTGDAWLGVFKSYDGGGTWRSVLIPGYPQDTSTTGASSPIKGLAAAADATVRAGTNGLLFYGGLAFNRGDGGASSVFVSRFIDDNNLEGGDTIRYVSTSVVARGDSKHFLDKPMIAVDIPRSGSPTCIIPGAGAAGAQTIAAGRMYITYTRFNGPESAANSTIMFSQSSDCGVTWTTPLAISGKSQTNQGSTLAIDPNMGTVYVAWRVFASKKDSDSIVGAAMQYGTSNFTQVVQVAPFAPFDQGTTSLSFRTNAYPSMAVDGSGTIYVAWSQRGMGPQGDARIMLIAGQPTYSGTKVTSVKVGGPIVVDPNSGRGHQIMPALAYSSGKLTAAWYDFRNDDEIALYTPAGGGLYSFSLTADGIPVFGPQISDPAAPYAATSRRHTVDVRAVQAPSGLPPAFPPSITVSQYAFGSPASAMNGVIQQLEYNVPNLPLFQQGTAPFVGDYIDVAGPTFVPAGTSWRYNNLPTDPDGTHVVWTDNRNVVQPADGNWANYTPVGLTSSGVSLFDPTQQHPACIVGQAGMRNQDIYTATLSAGVIMAAKGNAKPLSTTLQREFAVTVQNTTALTKSYRLSIGSQPPGGTASFLQFLLAGAPALTTLDISIPPLSSASRSVFITSTSATATVAVTAQEITAPSGSLVAGGLSSSTTLNADLSNPNISNPNISNTETYNPNISNPNISNPNISNPNISNPNISNPNISNVSITNPNISNPNISNPNISNPNISNPNISNPNISNPNISNTALTDVSYTVSNAGNTAASYTVQLLQNQVIPSGVTVQVIVSGIYTTPVANGCDLAVQAHYVPIVNVTSPVFVDAGSLALGGLPSATAPSFALVPGEQAMVTIRAYDSTTSDPAAALQHFNPATAITPAVVSTAANTGTTQPPLTLTITTTALPPASAGSPYVQTLSAVGGSGTGYTWTAVGSLPANLSLTTAGLLQGSPSLGTYTITVMVTDSGASSTSKTFTLLVNPAPAIATAALAPMDQGVPYTQQLTYSGGTAPLTWSATPGSLPSGLTVTSGGLLSGTPATFGSFTPAVTITDANGAAASRTYPVTVGAPLSIATTALMAGEQGTPYSQTLASAGGSLPINWTVTSGSLPSGLAMSSAGVITGTPLLAGGPFNLTVQATDAAGAIVTGSLSMTIAVGPSVATATIPGSTVNTPMTPTTLAVSGGVPQYAWALSSGSLPSGVTLSSAGVISGTPTTTGIFSFVAKVTDGFGATATRNFSMNSGPQITSGPLAGFQNYTYAATVLQAAGGAAPYTWTGAAISGMNLTPGGILTGFPTAAASDAVTVTDANGGTTTAPFTIAGPASVLGAGSPSVTTISNISLTGAGGTVQIVAPPGATIPVTFDYNLIEGTGYCPGCIDQIIVAFANTAPAACVYNGQPGTAGVSGSASVNLTAPTIPGRYYVVYHKHQQYNCPDAVTAGLSASDPAIAVVDVIPPSVPWLEATVSGASINNSGNYASLAPTAPYSVAFGYAIQPYAPAPNDQEQIQFGVNSQNPQQCGYDAVPPTGGQSGTGTVSMTAPSAPGRYFVSIDRSLDFACMQTNPNWWNGLPAGNAARYIGVIDVH